MLIFHLYYHTLLRITSVDSWMFRLFARENAPELFNQSLANQSLSLHSIWFHVEPSAKYTSSPSLWHKHDLCRNILPLGTRWTFHLQKSRSSHIKFQVSRSINSWSIEKRVRRIVRIAIIMNITFRKIKYSITTCRSSTTSWKRCDSFVQTSEAYILSRAFTAVDIYGTAIENLDYRSLHIVLEYYYLRTSTNSGNRRFEWVFFIAKLDDCAHCRPV